MTQAVEFFFCCPAGDGANKSALTTWAVATPEAAGVGRLASRAKWGRYRPKFGFLLAPFSCSVAGHLFLFLPLLIAANGKLDEMLAAQGDSKLGVFIRKPTQRYVPVEELARQWREKQDTKTLNRLTGEWIDYIYEGYPLEAVTALMGQPQRSGRDYVQYVSKENHVLYLGVNAASRLVKRMDRGS